MEFQIKNWDEFANWLYKKEKHREELEQDNIDLTKEVRQLRSELEQIKNATAENSDKTIFNTDSIPRMLRKHKE